MKFHTTMGGALGLLICFGAQSQAAPEKPLDIMKFMREQAASTRAAEPRKPQAKAQEKAKAQHPAPHRAVAAKDTAKSTVKNTATTMAEPKSAPPPPPMLPEAAAAFAAPAPAASPFPPPPQAETVGSAVRTGPNVQLVDAGEVNDIDRKAESAPPLAATPAPTAPASTSWLSAIWSALGNLFGALVTAVHQLIGI